MVFQAGAWEGGPRISAVIPVLNEARNLPHVLSLVPENVDELILVDGHSVDDSIRVARELRPDVHVVMQTRKGKGLPVASQRRRATSS
jgi:glycosyltransferase involved in cell wall biosynthesis